MSALPSAGQMRNDALQGSRRVTRSPVQRAIEQMNDLAETWAIERHERGVAILIREPYRIPRSVYGISAALEWPCGKSMVELLADCREFLRCQEEQARENHWLYDHNRLIALQQAEAALIRMLGGN